MDLTHQPLDDLQAAADPLNPKDHDIGALVVSLRRHGFVDPVVVDRRTDRIVAGHGRIQALAVMRDDGHEPPDNARDWLVPTIEVATVDDDQARALLVALNRTTELGGWNTGDLADLLQQLDQADALEGSGYDRDDLDSLLAELDGTGPPWPEGDQDVETAGAGGGSRLSAERTCPACGHTWTDEPKADQ